MTSNGRGEDLEATLNQGMHRHFRHKNTNRFPPTKQSDSPVNTSSSPPPSPGLSQDDSEDEYMHVLEEFMDGNIIASRHRRQASVAYRGVEYALSPTLKSPPIVFPRIASPLSPQYYHRPSYQTQTPIQNGIRLQSPTPLYNRTQNFRNRPAPLQLQDSPTLGNWTHLTPQQQPPSPVATPYLLDDYYGGGDEDSDDDEFPIRPSAALLPYKRQQDQGDPPPPPPPQRKRLPDLLQDVLEIMDSITSQQSQLEEESMALQDMVELVVTMQEQADSLMEYSDLVEEYVDLVNDEVTPAQASPSSSSNYSVDAVDVREEEEEVEEEDPTDMDPGARELASRADSGVSVGYDTVTDSEVDPRPTTGRGRANRRVMSSTRGKAKQVSREPPFRDSGLGLMSPDMVSPETTARGKRAPQRGRGARSSGTRGRASRLSGR